MSNFQYEKLSRGGPEPWIRILELFPGEPEKPLQCSLRNVQLSLTLKYEALSYCWGEPSLTHTVSCNDFEMPVTLSLYLALSRLRNKGRARILWADAICINQEDESEKADQVCLMATIYSRATQVNIWLGEHDSGSETLGDFITQVYDARVKYQATANARSLPELSATELGRLGIPGRYDLGYLALSALVNRPWFDRVWVIQEVAKSSAAIVFCGDWTVPWPHLIEAANWIYEMGIGHAIRLFADEGTPKQNQRYLQWTESKVRSRVPQSLLTLLIRHRQCLSSDPRDKIFALRGLADDADVVNVDYKGSKEEVYMNTTIALIRRHQTLGVVSAAGLPPYPSVPTRSSLPSWVPDWTRQDTFVSLLTRRMDGSVVYPANCAPLRVHSMDFKADQKLLSVKGMLFDKVTQIGSPYRAQKAPSGGPGYQERTIWSMWSNYIESEGCFIEWQEVFDVESSNEYVSGGTVLDAFWQTMCAGCLPYGGFEAGRRAFQNWDRMPLPARVLGSLGFNYRTTSYKLLSIPLAMAVGIGTAIRNIFWGRQPQSLLFQQMGVAAIGRRMVKTSQGYLALSPAATEVGDKVALVPGSGLPLFLRPRTIDSHFILIGEGYVHGVMNGEMFQLESCTTLHLE